MTTTAFTVGGKDNVSVSEGGHAGWVDDLKCTDGCKKRQSETKQTAFLNIAGYSWLCAACLADKLNSGELVISQPGATPVERVQETEPDSAFEVNW